MRERARRWCRGGEQDAAQDPTAAPGLPAMEDQDGRSRHSEPDAGVPGHVGPVKQLHSGTGYNLAVGGSVFGTREPSHPQAVLHITARDAGEVQIQGLQSGYYVAMDENGTIYAERDPNSPNTWFKELYRDGWNYYKWLGNEEEWYLAINKKGKMKPGQRTKIKQKSVKFIPRAASP